MITRVRHMLLCRDIGHVPDVGMNYMGVFGGRLDVANKPGAASVTLAIQAEVNGQGAAGELKVSAPDFTAVFPFTTPRGIDETIVATPILVPVVREGQLQITLEQPGGPSFTETFELGYRRGALPLPGIGPAAILADAMRAAEEFRENAATARGMITPANAP